MHLTIKSADLAKITLRIQGALLEKSLSHISLKAANERLEVSAADRVVAIYTSSSASVTEEGVAFVPAKIFSDVVRELPKTNIALKAEGSFLLIRAQSASEFVMKVPLIDDLSWKEAASFEPSVESAKIPATKLSYLLEQVLFCVSKDSSRNYGTVGYFHKSGENNLRLVGSDGYRLSYCNIQQATPKDFLPKGVCLTKRSLGEILRLCAEEAEYIELSHSDTTLKAAVDDYQVYMLLSAIKYPAYQSVLPKKMPKTACVSRLDFQSTARRILLAADKRRALQLKFTTEGLALRSKTQGVTEGRENIALKEYDGSNCKLAVHGKYLTDIFSNMVGSDVSISFNTEDQPVMFMPQEEPAGCQSRHILVPIREADN